MIVGRAGRGVLLGATLLAVATIALSSLTVFDFWWYLASGQRIIETRSVPTTDPFSYTAEGRPWINHMWATQVLFALLWDRWGRGALIALKTATVVATFGVVLATMRARGVHPLLACATTLLAVSAGAEFWHARPQTVTYLFVAILCWLLRAGWERRPIALVLAPALVVPWVNLHAGFVMAFVVIGLTGLGTALPLLVDRQRRLAGWRVVGLTTLLGVSAVAASLLNPYGVRAILFPLEVVRSVPFMTSTIEWFSPNFHHVAFRPLELMLVLLFPAFAWGRGRLSAADVGMILAFAHLGLTSVRHVPLFAIVAAPPLADALQGIVGTLPRVDWAWLRDAAQRRLPTLGPSLTAPGTPLLAGGVMLLAAVSGYWAAMAGLPTNPLRLDLHESRYPARTMAFIREHRLPPPLFSVYAWGGYELWRLYPDYRMFMDGRTHVYGPDVLKDFLEVTQVGPRWPIVLDKWQVQTILALRPSSLTETLLAQGGWQLVFTEREAAVFVRETEANQPLLARLARLSREAVAAGRVEAGRTGNLVHTLGRISDGAMLASFASRLHYQEFDPTFTCWNRCCTHGDPC
jgi:hypothetical protein